MLVNISGRHRLFALKNYFHYVFHVNSSFDSFFNRQMHVSLHQFDFNIVSHEYLFNDMD